MTSDLLEENQDLRKEITELRNNVEDMKDKLTKAKEIIKAFYEDNFDEAEFYSLQRKAEQFLSEVDK